MRLKFLDTAKALCIILVVIGHFNPSVSPDWWRSLIRVIYTFHMPLFMFVSGLLYSLTYRDTGYWSFVGAKLRRLGLPYLLTSAAVITVKIVMQGFMPVRNPVGPDAFLSMFWSPSAAVHLWFLWTLTGIFLIVPLFKTKTSRLLFGAAALALWLAPVQFPGIFCLDKFKEMLIFFAAGMIFHTYGGLELLKSESKAFRLSPLVFLLLFAVFLWMNLNAVFQPFSGLLASFAGIALLLLLSRIIAGWNMRWLTVIEANVFFIYLTHSIFIEGVKGVSALAGLRPEDHFLLCFLAATLAGILGPTVLRELCLFVKHRLERLMAP